MSNSELFKAWNRVLREEARASALYLFACLYEQRGFAWMAETDISEELSLYFSSPGPGGASLHKAIADKIIAHLISEGESDMEFVESLSTNDLVEILHNATGKAPMDYIFMRIRAFADPDFEAEPANNRSPLASHAGDKKGHRVGDGEARKHESAPKKKDQHTNDMTAQGMEHAMTRQQAD